MAKNNINDYKTWEISQDMDVYASNEDEEKKNKGEKISFILSKLEVLTPKQKEVVILTLLEGKSPKEICKLMNISAGRYQNLYKNSVIRLRRVYNIHKKNDFNID